MFGLIADLGSGDEKVKKVEVKKFLTPGYSTSGHVELYTVCTDLIYDTNVLVLIVVWYKVLFCVFRWVWSGECHGRTPPTSGLIRMDQMMASMYRWGLNLRLMIEFAIYRNSNSSGFIKVRNNKKIAILVKEVDSRKRFFMVHRPNTGKQVKLETYVDLKKRSKKVF